MAQDAPSEDDLARERLRQLRDFRQSQYPGFVSEEAVAPTPAPEPSVPPTPAPQLLVDDTPSTTTWFQTRERLEPGMEEIRMLMISRATSQEIAAQEEKFIGDLDAVVRMANFQAPGQAGGLGAIRSRIVRQLGYLIEDYAAGEWRKLETTEELLRRSMKEAQYLLFRSDLDRGLASPAATVLPADWDTSRFGSPRFAAQIADWDGARLLGSYRGRHAQIESALRRNRQFHDPIAAREMAELARQLATRVNEVPVTSATAFRDAALRLDVLAENLDDQLAAQNTLYARRQLRLMGHAIDDVEAYLALRRQNAD